MLLLRYEEQGVEKTHPLKAGSDDRRPAADVRSRPQRSERLAPPRDDSRRRRPLLSCRMPAAGSARSSNGERLLPTEDEVRRQSGGHSQARRSRADVRAASDRARTAHRGPRDRRRPGHDHPAGRPLSRRRRLAPVEVHLIKLLADVGRTLRQQPVAARCPQARRRPGVRRRAGRARVPDAARLGRRGAVGARARAIATDRSRRIRRSAGWSCGASCANASRSSPSMRRPIRDWASPTASCASTSGRSCARRCGAARKSSACSTWTARGAAQFTGQRSRRVHRAHQRRGDRDRAGAAVGAAARRDEAARAAAALSLAGGRQPDHPRAEGDDSMPAAQERDVTVMFCDLVGFTTLCEPLPPVAGGDAPQRVPHAHDRRGLRARRARSTSSSATRCWRCSARRSSSRTTR